jgi:hypothetical protein
MSTREYSPWRHDDLLGANRRRRNPEPPTTKTSWWTHTQPQGFTAAATDRQDQMQGSIVITAKDSNGRAR